MSYIVAGIRHLCDGAEGVGEGRVSGRVDWVPTMSSSWLVTLVFALMMMVLATALMHRRQKGEFQ
ncbi:MAG: hypothetical protein ACKOAU_12350, partial [Pirellula sp.]